MDPQQVMSPEQGEKVVRLLGVENYQLWKFQIKIVLMSFDLFDIVSGATVLPVKLDAAFAVRLNAWKKSDLHAQRIISSSITERPLMFIVNCQLSSEMWKKFEVIYENQCDLNIHLLQQQYYNLKIESNESIATFIARIENITHKLNVLGSKISDNMIITKILISLPENLRYFNCAWESTLAENKTLPNLTSRLIAEELRFKQDETPMALFSRKQTNESVRLCYHCKKPGHLKRNCWLLKKSNGQEEKKNDENKKVSSDSKSFESEAMTMFRDLESLSDDCSWFMDSGASDHMSMKIEWFSDYESFNLPLEIKVGNGSLIKAYGKGIIKLRSFVDGKIINCHLENVLYVPKITMNLISLGSVLDKGFELFSNQEVCTLKKNNKVFCIGKRFRGLYKMMVELRADESNSFNVCRAESYDLWHARLGHQGKNYINNVLKNHNINFSAKDYFCEGCIFGKQTRFSFEESTKRATNIGDLVHSDVCGPMEVESVGGSKFFVIFKDDFSKYRVIYPISSKCTVIEKFKDFCAKLKKETGKSVVRLRTDNGTEYVNKFFSDFMNCNNIINETSVPYTPEQNGRAEREMRTIVEMARTMIHSKNLDVNLWAEAVNTAVYIINRTYINDNNGKSPYEIWFNEVPDISYFRVFGSYVYCHVPKVKRQK